MRCIKDFDKFPGKLAQLVQNGIGDVQSLSKRKYEKTGVWAFQRL